VLATQLQRSKRVAASNNFSSTSLLTKQGGRTVGSQLYPCGVDFLMRYHLEITEEARQQLRALPKKQRRRVGRRLDTLQSNFSGDVKKLTAKTHEYPLRIGKLRVLFTLEKDLISVYAVRHRKQAYEQGC